MIYRYENNDMTIISAFDESTGKAVVFEVDGESWGEVSSRTDILDYAEDEYVNNIPSTISRFQARAALLDAGLLADVEIALADAGPLTQLAWAEAVEWRRDSPTIAAIGVAIGLREEDIDNLFIEAAKIKA